MNSVPTGQLDVFEHRVRFILFPGNLLTLINSCSIVLSRCFWSVWVRCADNILDFDTKYQCSINTHHTLFNWHLYGNVIETNTHFVCYSILYTELDVLLAREFIHPSFDRDKKTWIWSFTLNTFGWIVF